MVGIVTIAGLVTSAIGIILAYIWHIRSNRPTAPEIEQALHRRLRIDATNQSEVGEHHIVDVLGVKVSEDDSWLWEYDNPYEQLGHAFFRGLFVGTAEVEQYYKFPDQFPDGSKIKSHPYFDSSLSSKDGEFGVDGFDIEIEGNSLLLHVRFWSESVDGGAVAVLGVHTVLGNMIDQIVSGKAEASPDSISHVSEVFKGPRIKEDQSPFVEMENIRETGFVPPDEVE